MLAPAPPADTLVLPLAAPFVAVTVNGAPMRLRVAFDAPFPLTLTRQAATRAHLAATGPATVLVGPVRLTGQAAEADLALGPARRKTRLMWLPAAPTDDAAADGLVSPAALPVGTVRMTRPGPPAPVTGAMAVRVDPGSGIVARMAADGGPIDLFLAPQRSESIATAAAGGVLARALGGTVDPATPPTRRILFNVERPVRWLTFDRPLRVAGVTLGRMLVRTQDFPGGTPLPQEDAPNPDEIVVTGGTGRPRLRLTLGADALGDCTAITWQAATSRLILECP